MKKTETIKSKTDKRVKTNQLIHKVDLEISSLLSVLHKPKKIRKTSGNLKKKSLCPGQLEETIDLLSQL